MSYYAKSIAGRFMSFPTEYERDGWLHMSNTGRGTSKLLEAEPPAGDCELDVFEACGLYRLMIELDYFGSEDLETERLCLSEGAFVPQRARIPLDLLGYWEIPEAIAAARDEAQHIVEERGGVDWESYVIVFATNASGRTRRLAVYESYEGGSGCGYHIPEPINPDEPEEVFETLASYLSRPMGYRCDWVTDEEHARALSGCVEDLEFWALDLTAEQVESAIPFATSENYHLEAEALAAIAAERRAA